MKQSSEFGLMEFAGMITFFITLKQPERMVEWLFEDSVMVGNTRAEAVSSLFL